MCQKQVFFLEFLISLKEKVHKKSKSQNQSQNGVKYDSPTCCKSLIKSLFSLIKILIQQIVLLVNYYIKN